MSVFVVTQERLQEQLKAAGFQPTTTKTAHNTIWKNEKGDLLPVNHTELAFPPEYLNELLGAYGITATWQGEVVDIRKVNISPKSINQSP